MSEIDLFKLAKELNLVETYYTCGEKTPQKKSKKKKKGAVKQKYKYLLCVDFEATCWEVSSWKRQPETIEFPVVLVNVNSGKVETQFREYVMPVEQPRLSDFCTKLTGITQKDVESGVPLPTCLMRFNEWLLDLVDQKHLILPKSCTENPDGNVAFVTWSNWDFTRCLHNETHRKRITKPQYFDRWIDLKQVYHHFYRYRPTNFGDALTHVGIQFEGRPHCGLDDATNLARLAHQMIVDGAELETTKDMRPTITKIRMV